MRLEVKRGLGCESYGSWVKELQLYSLGVGEQRKDFQ